MHLVLNFLGLYTLYSTVIFKSNSTHMTPLGALGSYLTKEHFEHFLTHIRVDKASGFQTSEGLLPAEHLLTSALFLTEMLNLNTLLPQGPLKRIKAKNSKEITYVAVLHGSDVRPQAAVRRSQNGLHAGLQLVEGHGEIGEVVHLQEETDGGILTILKNKQTTQPSGAQRRLCSCGTVAESGGLESILHSKVLPGTTQTVSWISGMSSASSLSAPSTTSCEKKSKPKS